MNTNAAVSLEQNDFATSADGAVSISENTAVASGDASTVTAAPVTVANVRKKPSGRPVDPNSKFSACRRLFADMSAAGKTRKEIIAAFQTEIHVAEGTAGVYYVNAKKLASTGSA